MYTMRQHTAKELDTVEETLSSPDESRRADFDLREGARKGRKCEGREYRTHGYLRCYDAF